MNTHKKILELITEINNSNPIMKDIFLNGSCFNFYHILKVVFNDAEPYCNIDHVITKINDKYYDITGEITDINGYSHIGNIWGIGSCYNDKKDYKKGDMYLLENKAKYIRDKSNLLTTDDFSNCG
jgi:hypothetical protein